MLKTRIVCTVVLCLMLATAGFAQTQASTGQIAGTVNDATGAVVPNATVRVVSTAIGVDRTVASNDAGIFRAVLLPAGTYQVTVNAKGFAEAKANTVVVEVGRTVNLELRLNVGQVAESVEVSTEGVQVNRSEADSLLNQAAIDNLPINGRRFHDFVTLTPTAQVDPQRGQISLSGQRGIYGANINIDGLDYNQPFFGGLRGGERSNNAYTIPQESIREFQVVAAGYSAEFGRSTGGVVTAITKSGTNAVHGSAFYLHRDKATAHSNEFFDTVATQLGVPVTPAPTQQQWGASIGGAIKADKLFYFGSYEGQRFRNDRLVQFPNLVGVTSTNANAEALAFFHSLEGPFQQTNDVHAYLIKTDYQISQNHRLNLRYNYSWNEGKNAASQGQNSLFPTLNNAISNNGTEKDNTHTVVGQLTSIFGANVANDLRGQWSREERPRINNAEAPSVHSSIGRFGSVQFLPTVQSDWRFQIADSLSWTMGKHTFKFGGEYNHLYADQFFAFNQFGLFNFTTSTTGTILSIMSIDPTVATDHRFDSTSLTYTRQIGNGLVAFTQEQFGFFAQDSWKVTPRFTLNYGLRWEGSMNPKPVADNAALTTPVLAATTLPIGVVPDPTKNPDQLNQWGPRLGFAYDVMGDGKTVVRGYSGIYYANTPSLLYSGPLTNFRLPPGDLGIQIPFSTVGASAVPVATPCGNITPSTANTVWKQLCLIGVNLDTFNLGQLPILSAAEVQSIATAMGIPAANPFTGVSPILMASNFHNPRAIQYGLGAEHDFGGGLTVALDLTLINTTYLQRNRDINWNTPVPNVTTGRPVYNQSNRPLGPTIRQLQVRESNARALYRGATVRVNWKRKWGQLGAYYTLSQNNSSDDNERDSGGPQYDDAFNLASEYGLARIDSKHQFVANPVIYLPWGFDVSSSIRLNSGRPVTAYAGSDLNADGVNLDRPYSAVGVPFKRNTFRNEPFNTVDLRVQKSFKLKESMKVAVSAEFFNLFNAMNIQIPTSTSNPATTNSYCTGTVTTCGFSAPTNINFLQIRDQNPGSFGKLLTSNLPGTPLQAQFGVRFTF